jgi:NAD(P)-dependent dehydrogenase (short-subunit alcohol dehydrogenase family)
MRRGLQSPALEEHPVIWNDTLAEARSRHRARELEGSTAIVTGGGRGIGRLLAERLADAGASVGVIARSADELDETVERIERDGGIAAPAVADVSDPVAFADAYARLRRRLGPVDLLVNNAGVIGPIGPAWDADAGDWWRTFEVNLRSVHLGIQLALPEMIARGGGRIVNLTSVAGVHRWPEVSAYAVSKAAVVKLTENLAVEARRHGVRVFSVHPGLLPIGLTEQALGSVPTTDAEARVAAWVEGELAAGRGAEPEAAAALVVELARGRADELSGRHLSVHDDLADLLNRIDEIRDGGLYSLRLRWLSA